MRTRIIYCVTMSLLCMTFSLTAQAQVVEGEGAQALYTKSLAATCANCHGTEGRTVPGSRVPALAGLDKAYLAAQLNAFKSGARSATVMHQISKGYSESQIELLAAYFSVQKK